MTLVNQSIIIRQYEHFHYFFISNYLSYALLELDFDSVLKLINCHFYFTFH